MGSPQGGVISPLLSNIYLHSFDTMFQQSGIEGKLVRYADDFVVLVKGNGRKVLDLIQKMLERLHLQVHPEKTRITDAYRGFDFLSVSFSDAPGPQERIALKESCRLWPADKAVKRVKAEGSRHHRKAVRSEAWKRSLKNSIRLSGGGTIIRPGCGPNGSVSCG